MASCHWQVRQFNNQRFPLNAETNLIAINDGHLYCISWILAVPPLPVRRVCSLRRAPTPRGGTIPVAQNKNVTRHSRICARDRSRLNANDHNWWTNMPLKRHQKSRAKKKKKKWRPYCMRHFQIGYSYIHNHVKLFWVLRLITSVLMSVIISPPPTHLIFSPSCHVP